MDGSQQTDHVPPELDDKGCGQRDSHIGQPLDLLALTAVGAPVAGQERQRADRHQERRQPPQPEGEHPGHLAGGAVQPADRVRCAVVHRAGRDRGRQGRHRTGGHGSPHHRSPARRRGPPIWEQEQQERDQPPVQRVHHRADPGRLQPARLVGRDVQRPDLVGVGRASQRHPETEQAPDPAVPVEWLVPDDQGAEDRGTERGDRLHGEHAPGVEGATEPPVVAGGQVERQRQRDQHQRQGAHRPPQQDDQSSAHSALGALNHHGSPPLSCCHHPLSRSRCRGRRHLAGPGDLPVR